MTTQKISPLAALTARGLGLVFLAVAAFVGLATVER